MSRGESKNFDERSFRTPRDIVSFNLSITKRVKAWGYEVRGLTVEPLLNAPTPKEPDPRRLKLQQRLQTLANGTGLSVEFVGHGKGWCFRSADENRGADTARARACEEREMTHEVLMLSTAWNLPAAVMKL